MPPPFGVVHSDGGSEVLWPLGPNLSFLIYMTAFGHSATCGHQQLISALQACCSQPSPHSSQKKPTQVGCCGAQIANKLVQPEPKSNSLFYSEPPLTCPSIVGGGEWNGKFYQSQNIMGFSGGIKTEHGTRNPTQLLCLLTKQV